MVSQSKMLQFVITEFGDVDAIKQMHVAIPEARGNLVRVRVRYAGLNFADVMQRRGTYPGMGDLPFALGMEVVGHVDAVGGDVNTVTVGERVFAKLAKGGYSEYAVAHSSHIFTIPDGIEDEDVLGLVGTSGQTAFGLVQSLKKPGDRPIFISAAAGGVGSILTQLCAHSGWEVVAGVSSGEKAQFVEALGASYVVRYDQEGWERKLQGIAGERGLAVAFDAIGGTVNRGALSALGDYGELVFYGGASGDLVGLPSEMVFPFVIGCKALRGFCLPGYYGSAEGVLSLTVNGLFERRLADMITHSASTIYPAAEVAEAHRSLESRASQGKLVLDMGR